MGDKLSFNRLKKCSLGVGKIALLLCCIYGGLCLSQDLPKWQLNLTPVNDEQTIRIDYFKGVNTFLAADKIADNEAQDCRDFLIDDGTLTRREGFWQTTGGSYDTVGSIIGMTYYNGEIFLVRAEGSIALGSKVYVDIYPDGDLIREWNDPSYIHWLLLRDSDQDFWWCGREAGVIFTSDFDNKEDKFSLTMPLPTELTDSDVIDSVQVRYIAKRSASYGTSYLKVILTSGATADTTTADLITTTITTFSHAWATNPDDAGAWTRSDLEDLKVAIWCENAPGAGCVMVGELWVRVYGGRAETAASGLLFDWPVYFTPVEDYLVIGTRIDTPVKYKNAQLDTLGDVIWGHATRYILKDSTAIYDSSQSFGIYDFSGAFFQILDSLWTFPIVSNSTHRLELVEKPPYADSGSNPYKIFCRPARTDYLDTGSVAAFAGDTLLVAATADWTDGEFDNNTYYVEITADSGLGQLRHICYNRNDTLFFWDDWEIKPGQSSKWGIFQRVMPRAPVAYWQDCIFAGGVYYKNRIYFSDPDDPEYFPLEQYLDAPGSRQDSILALGASQYLPDQSSDDIKGLWAFQEHMISMVVGTSPNFTIRVVADNISFIAPKSLVFIGDTPFYLGYDGVYAGVQKISQKVKKYINRMNRGYAKYSAAGYFDGYYLLSIPDSASTIPNLTLAYHVETQEWMPLSFGFTDFLTVFDDSLRLYMASLSSPHIFQYGGVSDTGQAFIPYWQSKQYEFDPVWVQIVKGFVSYDVDWDTGTVKLRVYEKDIVGDSIDFYGTGWDDSTQYFSDGLINNSFKFEITQGSDLDTLRVNRFGLWLNKKGVR